MSNDKFLDGLNRMGELLEKMKLERQEDEGNLVDDIRNKALEYTATHQFDYSQAFTSPDCRVEEPHDGFTSVQVWIAVPNEVLEA